MFLAARQIIEQGLKKSYIRKRRERRTQITWPLDVGIEISYQVTSKNVGASRTHQSDVKMRVADKEDININGKNYQVYVVQQDVRHKNYCTAHYTKTSWFDPKLGVMVKERIERTDQGFFKGKTSEIVLVGVTFRAKAPAMAQATPQPKVTAMPPPKPQQSAVSVQIDETPPVIDVPKAVETGNPVVLITGHISDDSRIMEVMLGEQSIPLAADGTIKVKRTVPRGISTFMITAFDEWGNQSQQTVNVRRSNKVVASVSARAEQRQSAFSDINFGTYHAIVIGNNDYALMPKLKTALNDAESVAWALEADYGFEVTLLTDATRADIIGALAKARATLKANDNLLVYYAGHGVLDSYAEEGFGCPSMPNPRTRRTGSPTATSRICCAPSGPSTSWWSPIPAIRELSFAVHRRRLGPRKNVRRGSSAW